MKRSALALALIGLLFASALSGCGLDTFVYLFPVSQLLHAPSTVDPQNNYFQFRTSDEDNGGNVYFKGFEVYYRIYNDSVQRGNDVTAINAYNDANPTTALLTLVSTYKYSRMAHSNRQTDIPLIQAAAGNRVISIRLNDFDFPTYQASYSEDGSNDGSGSLGVPRRTLNDGTTLKSFMYDDILTGDGDVRYNSSVSHDTWYVQAYVVAYGYDESYKPYYSSLFGLAHSIVLKP